MAFFQNMTKNVIFGGVKGTAMGRKWRRGGKSCIFGKNGNFRGKGVFLRNGQAYLPADRQIDSIGAKIGEKTPLKDEKRKMCPRYTDACVLFLGCGLVENIRFAGKHCKFRRNCAFLIGTGEGGKFVVLLHKIQLFF